MPLANELAELYRRDLTRLLQELRAFPDRQTLWRTLPGVTNSAGNLFLHLEGNLTEYIGRQLGGIAYTRHRDLEFSSSGIPIDALVQRVSLVQEKIPAIVAALSPAQLDEAYPERMYNRVLSVQQFLIHLYGHLSYHLGQIDYLRRILTNGSAVEFAGL
jgi:hypothetical protein